MDIKITQTNNPKAKPNEDDNLLFGTIFTDHMFIMDYDIDKGWHDARVIPYQPLSLDPATMVFHYGQEMFEGLKAYKTKDGRTLLFRPNKNAQRTNKTNKRLCIPEIEEEVFIDAIKTVIKQDEDWIPTKPGTSLYVRPFIIATDPFLGVRPSRTYKFMIILSPVGAYYPEGLNPVKIWVEDEYVRAVRGGLGEAKAGANYVASLKSQVEAKKEGYSQVLWLDGIERKYIEEVGAMNIFFKIGGKVITPALVGSILPGVTRDSVLTLCKEWNIPVEERKISIKEIYQEYLNGTLEEVFGTGTAAVISPVGELRWGDHIMNINNGEIGQLSHKLYDVITGIQLGEIEDKYNWTNEVK
ncbi:MAG TPA: branched-chain amino acid aminotransferase [Clostridiales bacterium]|nr:branched-chain amino acid aminotransferase [Clostridiales bacterium]